MPISPSPAEKILFESFQPLAAIAVTPTGVNTLLPLTNQQVPLWLPSTIAASLPDTVARSHLHTYTGPLRDQMAQLWANHRGLICCLATGAVVRLIAPLLVHKTTDPAIVVVDEAAQAVISLCGGHQGGADRLAQVVARYLGAMPILTGAANHRQQPAVDTWGIPFGWRRGPGDWTAVSAAIARGETVQVIQTAGATLWQATIGPEAAIRYLNAPPVAPPATPTQEEPAVLVSEVPKPEGLGSETAQLSQVWISAQVQIPESTGSIGAGPQVQWYPRVLWVGIGCERGTAPAVIATAVTQALQSQDLAAGAIAGVATIDLKADEAGLLAFCRDRDLPLRCFTAEQLQSVSVPTPSATVAAAVGTPSVAEAAALLAADQAGCVLGAGPAPCLLVPKQIVRQPDQPGAVTVAIAQASVEYTGRSGQLWLIGTGPGQLAQITPAAQAALSAADAVIGYSLYIDLIRPCLRSGQLIEALPITQERQRAERAIALAHWGLTVAVVSSGDCGIYGMAGLVLEELGRQGWDGQRPAVQVFPGITAMQAAAARVGAPLMHDFCAISLSDLLTPWPVIEKRLQAAAQADFVTALYNPRSQTRTQQIEQAQAIFLAYRSPDIPVALVRAAYRAEEQITLTTLGQMLDAAIDMLTVVLIGNQSTRRHGDWLITPRGYLGFGEGT